MEPLVENGDEGVSSVTAYLITAIVLYLTGHWIGGTVALVLAFLEA